MTEPTDEQARAFHDAGREVPGFAWFCAAGAAGGLLFSLCFPWGWAVLAAIGF